ncbi:MAG: glycosyltransferase family 4 protein [Gemmatimonadetes bacterium]|nr:glycosyltransferase family 4 protein [Gemmatimonadota bacterium]MCA9761867.1 glycosyltransferase family 4 protein [Gemmatimonadota bacterium]MCB9504749.1 glycosyltransferase family 4 protein [Gemmatimonadales bacterium]HPF62793.1 glycosyltransferase family 4 protein [Gemmatimonadales bacterium]HRX19313.1 glycosyltransferase family 4 protein [Gemmatimonadales bacterium]
MPTHDLLLTYDFPPLGGGIARMMEELARGHPPGSLIVSTGTIADQEEVDAALPNVVDRIPVAVGRLKTLQGRLLWSRRAAALARDPGARFAWCGTLRPAGYPARWAWERSRLPYGILFYGGDLLAVRPKLARSRLKRRAYAPLLDDAATLVAISHWTAGLLREVLLDLGLEDATQRIRVVPLGTDPMRFVPDAVAAERFRVSRGLPAGRWLVTVARLVPHKGIDTGIEVLAHLAAEHPDLRYAVIGRGTYHDALLAQATALGVADRLHILTDVGDDDLPGAFAMGEIYLGLSRQVGLDAEGFGIALLEASACAVPVVAGASGGIADAVENGVTGLLVTPDDPEAASDAVRHLLADGALARQLGAAGRARVERRFTWDRVVRDLRALAEEHGRP